MFHCLTFFLNLTWIALEFKCSTALCDLLAKGLVVRLLLSDCRSEIQISWYGTENVRIIDSHPHTLNSLSFTSLSYLRGNPVLILFPIRWLSMIFFSGYSHTLTNHISQIDIEFYQRQNFIARPSCKNCPDWKVEQKNINKCFPC